MCGRLAIWSSSSILNTLAAFLPSARVNISIQILADLASYYFDYALHYALQLGAERS